MSPDIEKLRNRPEEEHRAWIGKASLEQLDEYLAHFSDTPTFYRMATARQQQLQFAVLKKTHWTVTWSFWLLVASLVLTSIIGWKEILVFLCWLTVWLGWPIELLKCND
jgi:hypothetical protein